MWILPTDAAMLRFRRQTGDYPMRFLCATAAAAALAITAPVSAAVLAQGILTPVGGVATLNQSYFLGPNAQSGDYNIAVLFSGATSAAVQVLASARGFIVVGEWSDSLEYSDLGIATLIPGGLSFRVSLPTDDTYGEVWHVYDNFQVRVESSFQGDGAIRYRIESAFVPEPATWAMMIAGFGLVGFSVRARSRRGSMRAATA